MGKVWDWYKNLFTRKNKDKDKNKDKQTDYLGYLGYNKKLGKIYMIDLE